jgi:hypothetical protein
MQSNRRKAVRRVIGYGAKVVASDGSWNRDCRVLDVSQTGAKLAFEKATELPEDFILVLSQQGNAMRRCRVVWAAGREMGVRFERQAPSRI